MGKYLKKFENHSAYDAAQSGLILPNVSICVQENDVHYNPYVDPCTSKKVQTNYEWVEIGGIKWATKNVGALTVTDYGQYFQWGDTSGYTADQVTGNCHSKAFSLNDYKYHNNGYTKYNSTDGKTVLESVDDAATINMGEGWRMPTAGEWDTLSNAVRTAQTSNYNGSGVAGLVCTDKNDSSKELFFPAVGYYYNGSNVGAGGGGYWSSSLYSNMAMGYVSANYMGFGQRGVFWNINIGRHYGCSVRGILDE